MKNTKYGIPSLRREFPSDEACLEFIFDSLHCRHCSCGGKYKLIKGRKQFQCSKCRFQIAPTSATIFHKSPTPLTLWFQAILVFSNAKSGISAKQLQRELEVTYKCAWRILKLIREALKQGDDKLDGDVETDTAYFGGRGYSGKNNEDLSRVMKNKSVVMGAVKRGGKIRAKVVPDASSQAHGDFLRENINPKNTRLMTDQSNRYNLVATGYARYAVSHKHHEFARGDIHVNTIETFWSHVKRSIKGTHKVISKKYLQTYLDGFVFHYNNRHSDKERFSALLGALLRA